MVRKKVRWLRTVLVGVGLGVSCTTTGFYCVVVAMPGRSFSGAPPTLNDDEGIARDRMRADLEELAGSIGARNTEHPAAYARAAAFIDDRLRAAGLEPSRQTFEVDHVPCHNVHATVEGADDAVVVVGAHYDTAGESPGANDNGTGVVALLELARRLSRDRPAHRIVFAFFANEEPPYFRSDDMGSRRYADMLAADGTRVVAMLSLETMGAYSTKKGSQRYPSPFVGAFYPSRGDFIAFIGDVGSRALVRSSIGAFREVATIPSEGSAAPAHLPGVDWSDHASFWGHGWPALMVTDTAPYRYAHYHSTEDTPDKIDFDGLTRTTMGLVHVVRHLAGSR